MIDFLFVGVWGAVVHKQVTGKDVPDILKISRKTGSIGHCASQLLKKTYIEMKGFASEMLQLASTNAIDGSIPTIP